MEANKSQKKTLSNRNNALKSTGPKTAEGKEMVKRNALKHGLLAKEVVLSAGEGAENPEEFSALVSDLKAELIPVGTLEEMLVEKAASCYWRLRRGLRFEAGLIRKGLEDTAEEYYNQTEYNEEEGEDERVHKTDEEIDKELKENKEGVRYWKKDRRDLGKMYREGKSLDDIMDWKDNWDWLREEVEVLLDGEIDVDWDSITDANQLRQLLTTKAGWTDKQIWKAHLELCDKRIGHHKSQLIVLQKQKLENSFKLEVRRMVAVIPEEDNLNRLLRYEAAIERQFYKALNQLERLQRMRLGDKVPAPLAVDVDINSEN